MKSNLLTALSSGVILAMLGSAPAVADHGNPWAGPDDEVQSQFHDANQAKSVGRPGENEMRGQSSRNANPRAGQGAANGRGGNGGGRGNGGNTPGVDVGGGEADW